MEQYMTQFIALADGLKLSILLSMIAANVLIGIAASIYTGEFRLSAVADFMMKRVLPYIVAYFGVVVVAVVQSEWKALVTTIWAVLIAALVGHIAKNLKDMGVLLPDFIAGRKK